MGTVFSVEQTNSRATPSVMNNTNQTEQGLSEVNFLMLLLVQAQLYPSVMRRIKTRMVRL